MADENRYRRHIMKTMRGKKSQVDSLTPISVNYGEIKTFRLDDLNGEEYNIIRLTGVNAWEWIQKFPEKLHGWRKRSIAVLKKEAVSYTFPKIATAAWKVYEESVGVTNYSEGNQTHTFQRTDTRKVVIFYCRFVSLGFDETRSSIAYVLSTSSLVITDANQFGYQQGFWVKENINNFGLNGTWNSLCWIPDGVLSFSGLGAFSGFRPAVGVRIPKSLTSGGHGAFHPYSSPLIPQIIYQGNIKDWMKIKWAFNKNPSSNFQYISSPTFYIGSGGKIWFNDDILFQEEVVTEIEIEDGQTYISDQAVINANQFSKITIPSSVTLIGSGALYGNPISRVDFEGTLDQWDSIETSEQSHHGPTYGTLNVYWISSAYDLYCNGIKIDSVIVRHSNSVYQSANLDVVEISSSVSRIPAYAFANTRVSNIIFPSSNVSLGECCFSSLRTNVFVTLDIPSNVTNDDGVNNCFYSMQGSGKLRIPSSFTTFQNCAGSTRWKVIHNETATSVTYQWSIGPFYTDYQETITSFSILNYTSKYLVLRPTTPPTWKEDGVSSKSSIIFIPSGTLQAYTNSSHWNNKTLSFKEFTREANFSSFPQNPSDDTWWYADDTNTLYHYINGEFINFTDTCSK